MKRIVSLVAVAALVGAGVWGYLYTQSRGSAPKYRTARVERGPLTAAVSATQGVQVTATNGEKRFRASVRKAAALDAGEMRDAIITEAGTYFGDTARKDDITMVIGRIH